MALEISEQNQDQVITWQRLKSYKGFHLLSKELDEMIKEADLIIFKQGADYQKAYTDRDLAINKRDIAMRLKELPDRMIALLSGTGQAPPENPDAYGEQEDVDSGFFDNDDF